jgi:Xaa-Pro aminopeptidase
MANVEFPGAEYRRRYERAWRLMKDAGLAGLLATGESNHRYLTGHRTQFWVSLSRPMYTILPLGRPPVCLVTEVEAAVLRATSHVKDVRTWLGFADDSLPVLADILKELGFAGERVGVDFGQEMRLGLPLTCFRELERLARDVRFVDGSPLLWSLRKIKSAREIDYIRKACTATAKGLAHAFRVLKAGMTDRELALRMQAAMLEAGADRVRWCPIQAGRGNSAMFSHEPLGRRFRAGDTVWIDVGAQVHGYWSDFDRMAAVGRASARQKETYRAIWEVTRACIEAVGPGIPIADVVRVRDRAYARMGFVETGGRSGRMGHGSGLDITEPPSVASFDPTILEPGMVIHVEPKMIRPHGCFQLEEVLAVTKTGSEYLSPPAPKTLPVADAA